MFRASLCPSSEDQDVCYCTWCAALVLLDVVGSGCWALRCRVRTLTFTVLTSYNTAPNNSYQPHPAEPAQHTTCSNTRIVLLKMGIMMPETCWDSVDNKHLTVASCWFSLSLHNLLSMHGHRNLKLARHCTAGTVQSRATVSTPHRRCFYICTVIAVLRTDRSALREINWISILYLSGFRIPSPPWQNIYFEKQNVEYWKNVQVWA